MSWTNIFEAWGEPDKDARDDIIDALVTKDIHYADPHSGSVYGREAFAHVLQGFQAAMPGGYARALNSDGYAGHVRAAVEFGQDEQPFMTGQYVAELDGDGRIARLVGFSSMPTA